jgi:uroporphyrinogen decarboxylase
VDRRRIPFESYREQKRLAAEEERAFCWAGVAPFEQMHPVCGHEYMLMGMALDPDWVKDMVNVYADFTMMHLDVLFAEEGLPDVLWFYEDMGFKERPFMSPAMYEDIVMPGHRKLFDYAHSHDRKVIVHSCGFVEPLVPGLVNAGMDCLQAMEVKAGMDMPRIAEEFGDRIAFCGNIDIRIVASNDRQAIDDEITRKVTPVLKMGSGYILHSDHSIPPEVDHDTLAYFFQHGSRLPERI